MRYHRLRLFVLSVLTAALLGSPVTPRPSPWGEMLVKHKWTRLPDNWVTLGNPPDGATFDLHIALKPDRKNALIDALLEVSQPGHQRYGAHLTKEQVEQLVAPNTESLELVSSWLKYNGVPPSNISPSHGGCWLTVAGMHVSQANDLLRASYQLYHNPGTNETILRTVSYALPAALHKHVPTLSPATAFTSMRLLQPEETPRSSSSGAVNATSGEHVNMLSRRDSDPSDRDVNPSVLRWLYGTETYSPAAMDQNKLGIVGYKNEYPNLVNLRDFMTEFRSNAIGASPTIEIIDYSYRGRAGKQADLDVQYTLALAFPTPVIYYRGTGNGVQLSPGGKLAGPGDQYLQWLDYMLRKSSVPQTISLGFGTEEPSIPPEYAFALCDLFAQLGARGVSILVASGDFGVGRGNCRNAQGKVQFYTSFPASCPWVTSVGGTKFAPDSEVEVANGLSGGGFSAIFPRHNYQNVDVGLFLANFGEDYEGLYNPSGRGVPDIALYSSRYLVVTTIHDGQGPIPVVASGTSCSTNTAAAFFSLLNDYRLSKGKAALGFLNPVLYGVGWLGFNDITSGNNPGCNDDGFSAVDGWDPVTGLGSPHFPSLQELIDLNDFLGKDGQSQASSPPKNISAA